MPPPELASLVHLVGFTTGIVLYAMLGVMTARRPGDGHGGAFGEGAPEFPVRLPLLAAILGLLWNVGGLVVFGARDFGLAEPIALFVALAFSALGFLPAVVVQASLRGGFPTPARAALVVAAYALGAGATLLHLWGAMRGGVPSRPALLLLTVGHAVLLPLLALTTRRDASWRRNLSSVALAAFAVSALHLGHGIAERESWLMALVGHHASLPLVLVILYQDYRFAFADLFLRRALSLVALVAVALSLHVLVLTPLVAAYAERPNEGILVTAVHVAFWVLTALAYPLIRRGVGAFVERVILRRADTRHVRDDVAFTISRLDDPASVARRAGELLASAIGADAMRCVEHPPFAGDALDEGGHGATPRVTLHAEGRDGATVCIPTASQPSYDVSLSGMGGGRRLLSDDVVLLESVAILAGRRIDAIRVTQERFARDLREREILQLAAESELKALRAQLNPHFLFNALTTIGYLLQSSPDRALGTLYRLTDLLRAVLRSPAGDFVSLGEELEIVESYLAIERERFEERLLVHIDVPEELRAARIPPLLVQPLVENAVKHGISPLRQGGSLTVCATLEGEVSRRGGAPTLRIVVSDTGAGMAAGARRSPSGSGLGLSSVERRLQQHFGAAANLAVEAKSPRGTTVTLRLPFASGATEALDAVPAMRSVG